MLHPPASCRAGLVGHIIAEEVPWEIMADDARSEAMSTLSAMFPDVELNVLEAVLDSSGGDATAAVEALLSMTDEQRMSAPLSSDVARAAQVHEDEELARQLQQQLHFEEEFSHQQLLYQQQHLQQQQPQQPPNEPGYQPNYYPGANLGVAPHGNVADVYRPNAWGANAPPPQQQEDEGYTVSEALYDAGSSIRASASSWFNWAVGDEGGQQPARPRQESTHEAYEMQPMRRVRDDEPRAAADGFGDDASAAAGDDERVVHGGLAGGGGGEVRRRVRRSGGPGD